MKLMNVQIDHLEAGTLCCYFFIQMKQEGIQSCFGHNVSSLIKIALLALDL